jgi:hypothetical protein
VKTKYAILFLTFCLFICPFIKISYAGWDSINSGYAVTTNYQGKIVPPGTLVTATAGTTDHDVKNVTFLWKYPNETVAYEINVQVWSNGSTYNGKTIYYATSSYRPYVEGDWGVQALFIGEGGTKKANQTDVISIRSSSFNVIPDLPIVGTAGSVVTMLLGFSIFLRKRKKQL